jgi:imidazole glycerol-phosphate synthase subunit HisH
MPHRYECGKGDFMIAIIDYGVGNLFSLKASLKFLGAPAIVTGNPDEIKQADQIILPGVGAFGDAMDKLKQTGLDQVVIEEAGKGTPLLGICLGMQMLLDGSDEYGNHKGLGLIPGFVTSLVPYLKGELKVPHIGWNSLDFKEGEPLFKYIKQGQHVYYVHSYFATKCEPLYDCHFLLQNSGDWSAPAEQCDGNSVPPGEKRRRWIKYPSGLC